MKDRHELAATFRGVGAELGVAGGHFSSAILKHGQVAQLWSIDKWDDHHDLKEYKAAATLLATRGAGRCIPLRMTFNEAVGLFEDQSLSFVYVDGYAHLGQQDGKTLEMWWPKLRAGAIMAGHDYHSDFPKTIQAVDRFVADVGAEVNLTGEVKYPSWWFVKGPRS
jgi:hypothetical protein